MVVVTVVVELVVVVVAFRMAAHKHQHLSRLPGGEQKENHIHRLHIKEISKKNRRYNTDAQMFPPGVAEAK